MAKDIPGKKYCRHCEHESDGYIYKLINKFDGSVDKIYCYTRNIEGTCPYYKRLWYKFWVK